MDNIGGLLQHQLATDVTALSQVPIVLQTLTEDHLKPSQHTGKWMARIKSLLHSREASLRWTGLCLADKTSELSVQLMLEHAETWIGIVLPMLSKVEVEPVYSMSIRLLFRIFSSATHMTEFQRQVSIPNVSRYALAMIALAEKEVSISLQATILETLHALISIYPSVQRTGQSSLQKLALRHVSGTFPSPTPPEILSSASKLLATLHVSSGKTASSASWKKTIEGALATAAESLSTLRTTFTSTPPVARSGLEVPKLPDDPMIAMPLALDRLRCMTSVVSALLQSTLSTITTLLSNEPSKSDPSNHELGPTSGGRGKGKKRARGYEGDELLRNQPNGPQLGVGQSEEIIAAVNVLEALVASGFLSQPTLSTIHRVLLSLTFSLPQQTPQALSKDLGAYENFQQKIFTLSARIARQGKDGFAARSLGAVLSATTTLSEGPGATKAYLEAASCLESALHPRMPPLLKTAPPVEFFPLFRKEETKEERGIQDELRVSSVAESGAPGTLRNGFTHTASTGLAQNQSSSPIDTAPMPDNISVAPPAVVQPLVRQKASEPLPTTQPPAVLSFPSVNTTTALGVTSERDSSAIQSDSGIPPYEQPEWALPSTYGQTEPPQAPVMTSEETYGSPLRLPTSDDEDDDQQIPEIDMRSDTEDEE
ncbi:hypothetical protein FRC00_004232 [Tulasnella sp. 408]|nr:hypothetical protein FRC00_004232 [Tulasnella sp. 408]